MLNKAQDQWLEERKKLIGSSEVGIICGLSEYTSPLQLWLEKTERKARQNQDSPYLVFGNAVEPALGVLFKWHYRQFNIEESNKTFLHPEYDFLCATPDFDITPFGENHPQAQYLDDKSTGTLEAKFTKQFWDEIPLMYQLQLQWQLGIRGHTWGAIFALCGGDPMNPRCQFYRFDKSVFDFAMEKVLRFKEHLDNDTQPEAGSLDKATLAQIMEDNEEVVEIPDSEVAELIEKYFDAKRQKSNLAKEMKYWETEFKDVEAKLIQKLEGHTIGNTSKHVLKNNRVVVPAKMVNAYEFFRFSVKEKGNE